jgi:hypothetical protein
LDLGLRLLTGASARKDFGDRRRHVIPTLLEHFNQVQRIDQPPVLHLAVRLYAALELKQRRAPDSL